MTTHPTWESLICEKSTGLFWHCFSPFRRWRAMAESNSSGTRDTRGGATRQFSRSPSRIPSRCVRRTLSEVTAVTDPKHRGSYEAVVERAFPAFSFCNSASGMVNSEKPQSKQTETFGNNKTLGLLMFLLPEKWIIISAVNSAAILQQRSAQISLWAGSKPVFGLAHQHPRSFERNR